MEWLIWGLWLVGAYLVGAVPFGLLLGKAKGVDIRDVGSGNVGATNLGRALGKKWGIGCFFLDMSKGLAPVLIYGLACGAMDQIHGPAVMITATDGQSSTIAVGSISPTMAVARWLSVAMAAILGHVFPIYLRFKGGKGVATSSGALLGVFPYLTIPALLGFVVWYLTLKTSGYVGLASVLAAAVLPVLTVASGLLWGLDAGPVTVLGVVTGLLATLVIVKHRGNLQRLAAGTEPKIS